MHNSQEWKEALAQNNWTDAYLPADEFATFLQQENERVAERAPRARTDAGLSP